MKKQLFAAAVAACLMGAAQAVMVDWTGSYTSTGTYGTNLSEEATLSIEGDPFRPKKNWYQLSASFVLNATTRPSGFAAILSITRSSGGSGNDNANLRLSLNGNGELTLNGDVSASGDNAPPVLTGGALQTGVDYTVVLSMKTAEGASSGVANVQLYANGELFGTITDYTLNASYNAGALDTIVLGSASLTEANGNRTFGDGVLTVTEVTLIPEPTALALLALGVAGMALRRRVA